LRFRLSLKLDGPRLDVFDAALPFSHSSPTQLVWFITCFDIEKFDRTEPFSIDSRVTRQPRET